jgi:cobalamin biosynthesis protein CbiD
MKVSRSAAIAAAAAALSFVGAAQAAQVDITTLPGYEVEISLRKKMR